MGSTDGPREAALLPTIRLDSHGIEDKIPGLKTYTAFFTSLKANLALPEASAPPSPAPKPRISDSTAHITPLPPPQVKHKRNSSSKLHNVLFAEPSVSCYSTVDDADKDQALRLIAVGVEQQQLQAFLALLKHPINLCILALILLLIQRILCKSRADLPLLCSAWSLIILVGLVTAIWASWPYRKLAREVTREWLGGDELLVASVEQQGVVGAAVLNWRWTAGGDGKGRRKRAGKACIRAWTVGVKDRGKGIGKFLLEEAAQLVAKRGAERLDFAEKHAYSSRVLLNIYNGTFDRGERRAQEALWTVVETQGKSAKKR